MVKQEARILVHGCKGPVCCALALRGARSVEAVYVSLQGPGKLAQEIASSSVFLELEYEAGGSLGLPLKQLQDAPPMLRRRIKAYVEFAEILADRVLKLASASRNRYIATSP